MRKSGTVSNAVRKATIFRPEVRRVRGSESLWTVAASVPGEVYLLEVTGDGASCPCKGYESNGYCYHAAELEGQLGLLPEEYAPRAREEETVPAC